MDVNMGTSNSELKDLCRASRTIRSTDELTEIADGIIVTPKYDGYRAHTIEPTLASKDGKLHCCYTRGKKPVPNSYVESILSQLPPGCDGELVVPNGNFQDAAVITRKGFVECKFNYIIFDNWSSEGDWITRWSNLVIPSGFTCWKCPWKLVYTREDLEKAVAQLSTNEGCMLRKLSPDNYIFGRDPNLIKLKPDSQNEAIIVGFNERTYGHGLKTVSPLLWGQPKGDLGSLTVIGQDRFAGAKFNIGTGYDDKTRKMIWDNREELIGKTITFRYTESGSKRAPRLPKFVGIREMELDYA